MGLDVVVSEEAFLSTYKNGVRIAKQFAEAQQLKSEGMSAQAIGKIIGKHASTVKQWFRNEIRPDCVNGVEHAKKLGILPLTISSEKTEPIINLSGWAFWTGCISEEHDIVISEKEPRLHILQDYFRKTLALDSTIKSDPCTMHFNGNSHYYGRILIAMGIQVGRKSTYELHIPKGIANCPSTHLDFLSVLFATKTEQTGRCWTVNLPSNREYGRATAFGREVIAFFNAALPQAQIEQKQLSVLHRSIPPGYTEKQNDVYTPRICLRKKDIANIIQYYQKLVPVPPKIPMATTA